MSCEQPIACGRKCYHKYEMDDHLDVFVSHFYCFLKSLKFFTLLLGKMVCFISLCFSYLEDVGKGGVELSMMMIKYK